MAMNRKLDALTALTTSKGFEIHLAPINKLFLRDIVGEYQKRNPEPQKPTYIAVGLGGAEENRPHDETTLQTDEEKALWETYKAAYAEWKMKQDLTILESVLLQAVVLPEGWADDQEWVDFLEYSGIEIPRNTFKKKYLYITSWLTGSDADLQSIMQTVLEAPGVPEDAFRNVPQGGDNNSPDATA
jgi:hypothetical protein